jgi:hypothetical protein
LFSLFSLTHTSYTFALRFATIRPERHTMNAETLTTRSIPMGKSQDARKETKKKPAKTMKEKRAEKRGKS